MSMIRDVINSMDNSDQKLAEIRETLQILTSLAASQAQIFREEIELDLRTGKTTDNLTIPITKIASKQEQYRATSSEKTSDVLGELSTAIQGMISDPSASGIVAGVSDIASSALNTIMGVAEGEEQTVKLYFVVADYPAIVRFDFAFWARRIQAESIKKYCETALSCVAYKSAVDVTKLSFNDFLTLYGPILNKGFGSDPTKMEQMIEKAKKIYSMYTNSPLPSTAEALALVQRSTEPRGIVLSAPIRNF